MSLIDPLPWDANTPPAFTNEAGVKWWPSPDDTRWATREDLHGVTLPGALVWYVEMPNGYRTRILTVDGQYEFETTRMEDMAVHIDILKTAKRFDA